MTTGGRAPESPAGLYSLTFSLLKHTCRSSDIRGCRGRSRVLLALAALACFLPAPASAATTSIPDVSSSFWARSQIVWATNQGWVPLRSDGTFRPKRIATRLNAARVLTQLNHEVNGDPVSADPYGQAVDARWITAGSGPGGT